MSGAPPLAGRRIVDFSLYLPGPYATRLLADLGAEVIKVEPLRGDPMREFLPGIYEFVNRGKAVVRVDLKREEGRAAVDRLVASADAVLEGFRPGVAARLGIGYERCAELAGDLVYCSLSGYGQSGPERDHPGHDIGYEASGGGYAGVLAIGDPPAPPHLAAGDLSAAMFVALTLSATLAGRAAGAGATRVDVSMLESLTHLAATRWGRYLRDRVEPQLSDLGSYAPGNGFYATADDRWVALAAVEDKFWDGLCGALDRADLSAPPYDTHAGRMESRAVLREALAAELGGREAAGLVATLKAADVPVNVVATAAEVVADPHLRERGLIRELEDGLHLDFPVLIDGRRGSAGDALPDPALDGPRVLGEVGVDVEALRASGALGG
ncbi:MAG: CoA transferase [Actinobacteria bacterium]|nr:CoA transferase [Actinomycetota bacterium]